MKSEITLKDVGTTCRICGKECKSTTRLGIHITKHHKMSKLEYYDTFIHLDGSRICPVCHVNERACMSRGSWYRLPTCSECADKLNSERNKKMWESSLFKSSQSAKFKQAWTAERKHEQSEMMKHLYETSEKMYTGVKAMQKRIYKDSTFDLQAFKSYRLKIKNSYLTQNKTKINFGIVYLAESDKALKIGITQDLDNRMSTLGVRLLSYHVLPLDEALELEFNLLIKYFKSLKPGTVTLSEWINKSEKQNLLKDFSDIRNGIYEHGLCNT